MKFILSIIILFLTFSRTSASKYKKERIMKYLNSANDVLIIQKGTFSFGFSSSLKKGLFILSIEKQDRRTKEYSTLYSEYLLDSAQIEYINGRISEMDFEAPKEIPGYNFNWLDCYFTRIEYKSRYWLYDCLDQQDLKELEELKVLIQSVVQRIDLEGKYKLFHQSLPKGNYRAGMTNIIKV